MYVVVILLFFKATISLESGHRCLGLIFTRFSLVWYFCSVVLRYLKNLQLLKTYLIIDVDRTTGRFFKTLYK